MTLATHYRTPRHCQINYQMCHLARINQIKFGYEHAIPDWVSKQKSFIIHKWVIELHPQPSKRENTKHKVGSPPRQGLHTWLSLLRRGQLRQPFARRNARSFSSGCPAPQFQRWTHVFGQWTQYEINNLIIHLGGQCNSKLTKYRINELIN